jgi:hypothetical protein
MLPTTLDIGMQSDHCHRVVAEHEHRVTLLSQKRTRKSLITTNPTNRYYCSHLSRTLLIIDLFMIGPELVTINWMNRPTYALIL